MFEKSKLKSILEHNLQEIMSHSIFVSIISEAIVKELGLDDLDCYEISKAAIYHDIGKLKLSRYIDGYYPDALSSEEIKYMRMHSKLSYDLLKDKGFSKFVEDAILYHHENYNGTGYPSGLKGEEIPIGARILRVSDVFSALISKRTYREGFDIDSAVDLMIDEIENYDMQVFVSFQKIINKPEIRNTLEEKRL